jgi:hypothetical protein
MLTRRTQIITKAVCFKYSAILFSSSAYCPTGMFMEFGSDQSNQHESAPKLSLHRMKPNQDGSNLDDQRQLHVDHFENGIIEADSNFCVVNKPWGVRMNGEFPVTVEKLMMHWLPGISINSLKWVHQLDFATSGVLCVALNRRSAAVASLSFENRDVSKNYLAVLQGKVQFDDWPLLDDRTPFDETNSGVLDSRHVIHGVAYNKRKFSEQIEPMPQGGTGPGAAVQASLPTWQDELKETNMKISYEAFTAWKLAHADTDMPADAAQVVSSPSVATAGTYNSGFGGGAEFTQFAAAHPAQWKLLQPIVHTDYDEFMRKPKLRKVLRKFLRGVSTGGGGGEGGGGDMGAGGGTPLVSHHSRCPEALAQAAQAKEAAETAEAATAPDAYELSPEMVRAIRTYYRYRDMRRPLHNPLPLPHQGQDQDQEPHSSDGSNSLSPSHSHSPSQSPSQSEGIDSRRGGQLGESVDDARGPPRIYRVRHPRAAQGYRLVVQIPVAEIPGDFRYVAWAVFFFFFLLALYPRSLC